MFGRKNGGGEDFPALPGRAPASKSFDFPHQPAQAPGTKPPGAQSAHAAAGSGPAPDARKADEYYDLKRQLFGALIEIIDVSQLTRMDVDRARAEISEVVSEIVAAKKVVMSTAEQKALLEDICNDVLGYGPLEPLLARDDIADIMVNGSNRIFIEVAGKVIETDVRFRDNAQLVNVCQRIVSQVGRRVDESSPICDARLPDGSRVNVIVAPLAIDGAALTIRKFKRDKLTLDQLVGHGTISAQGAEILKIISRVRCNVVISGGTGSGKTTLLNCLTRYIDQDERIITCEDVAELQLQQPHTVRLETRPPNIEGEGEITMRDLVRNCLRMRPERIIVGEVRGPEAFDLLQAMNTGHDGSMGTLHANSPREALSRLEAMITMASLLPPLKDHPSDDLRVHRRDRPDPTYARRCTPRHPHHRDSRHGGRRSDHAGPFRLRDAGGRQDRQGGRPTPLDRDRPSAFLGPGPILRRGEATRRGDRCGGSPEAGRRRQHPRRRAMRSS